MEGETIVLGALADSVQEVIDLEPEQIEPAAPHRHQAQHRFHPGHGQAQRDQFIMILDIDKVFSEGEKAAILGVEGEAANG